jgi:hypothetical protein
LGRKIGKLEEKKEENPSDDVKKKLEKAKKKKKKVSWRVSVLEGEESLMKLLDDKAEDDVKKKLGEELLKKEETIRKEKEKLDEVINREREGAAGLSGTELDRWAERIKRLEKKQIRFEKELGRDEFLTLFEFEKREKEETRRETAEDLKREGAEYKAMKDEKGRFFTGQRLEVTEDQFKEVRREMTNATGERGKKIKKAFLSALTSIGYFFGGLVEILWEGVKFWARAGSKEKEKKK